MRSLVFIVFVLSVTNAAGFIRSYLDINDIITFGNDMGTYYDNYDRLRQKMLHQALIEAQTSNYYKTKIEEPMKELIRATIIQSSYPAMSTNIRVTLMGAMDKLDHQFDKYINEITNAKNISMLCALCELPEYNNTVSTVDSHLKHAFDDIIEGMGKYKQVGLRCDSNVTIPDQIIALYNLMAAFERKKFLMGTFTFQTQMKCNSWNFPTNLPDLQDVMVQKILDYLRAVKLSIPHFPRDLYRCTLVKSPRKSQKNDDENWQDLPYIELEGYQKTVLINEYNRQDITNPCSSTCEDFTDNPNHKNIVYRQEYCMGRLINCKSAGETKLCKQREGKSSLTHYQWFKTGNDQEYGNVSTCREPVNTMSTSYSWSLNLCDNCMCTCIDDVESSPSRYIISLRPEMADIKNNYVMTGIQFIMKGKVIYPKIQTGKLIQEGRIDNNTIQWKLVDPVNGVLKTAHYHSISDFARFGMAGTDVQSIDLDTVYADMNKVVTGIRFMKLQNELPSAGYTIGLDVHTTGVDYATGQLLIDNEEWVDAGASSYPSDEEPAPNSKRTELELNEPDSPLSSSINVPSSQNKRFVKFQLSDMKKDAGQSTVPFLDATPVGGTPPIPLAGVGLDHKGPRGSGGFVGFRVIGLDYSRYINTAQHKQANGVRLSLLKSRNVEENK